MIRLIAIIICLIFSLKLLALCQLLHFGPFAFYLERIGQFQFFSLKIRFFITIIFFHKTRKDKGVKSAIKSQISILN